MSRGAAVLRYLNSQPHSTEVLEIAAERLGVQCFAADGDCFYRCFAAALGDRHAGGGGTGLLIF